MKKLFFIIFFVVIFTLPIYAEENINNQIFNDIDEEYFAFESSLPDYVKDFFPKDLLEGNFSNISVNDISQQSFLDYIINHLLSYLPVILKKFANLFVLLLISSIFNTLKTSFASEGLKNAFSICSSLCVSICIFSSVSTILDMSIDYIKILCSTMNSFCPLMSTLYLLTGSISSATVSNTSMMLFLAIVENFVLYGLAPIMKICLCFSIVTSISGTTDLSGISKTLKNAFISICVFLVSIFSFVLSSQSVLTHSIDSLSLRTAKFAIGNFIPIVGGFISDSLKTVSASLSLIKNSCGVFAIFVILLLILPVIISLILNKFFFNLASGVSKALGSENESRICDEASNLCSFALSIIALCSVVFVFALTIFIKSSVEVSQ